MNPGYIYILQNPSLSESHLKIGRTERDPDERAAEISSATGVPTPFEVVWWSESVDCHLAESILHQHLDLYRTNTTREFFDLELDEAIQIAKRAIRQSGGRTGGFTYYLRRLGSGIFHSIIRPLLRLPVQIFLLGVLIAYWLIKVTLLLAWGILHAVFLTLGALFTTQNKKSKRRKKKTLSQPGSRQSLGMAMQSNHWYLKEIVGAILWIASTYFAFSADGVNRLSEILMNLSLSDLSGQF